MALIDFITQIQFGVISLLGQQCERVGIRRPLIVTDRGVKAGRPGDAEPADRGRGLPRALRQPQTLKLQAARATPLSSTPRSRRRIRPPDLRRAQ